MAKLEKEAWPGFEFRGGEDYRAYDARCTKLIEEIRAKHPIVKFPIADGYALYAVTSEAPLVLRHIPYGDGYKAAAATIRGLNLADVRQQQAFDKMWEDKDRENDAFYDSLFLGQVVHYHNAFGEYVRCEVTEQEGKKVLRPFALVGAWREHDLPRRLPDGTVREGYHVTRVREGKTMHPHSSCIWESPKYHRPDGTPDPRGLQPLDLSVPAPSAEEEERARLWRKVKEVRAILSPDRADERDPAEILASARAALAA